MSSRVPPLARIRLARSPVRLLALPLLLLLLGATTVGAAVLGPMRAGEPGWIALVAAAALLALVALALMAWLLSIRLEVEEAALHVRWLGGERVHPLAPGPVTRVRLRGANASSLRSRTGFLGWTVGRTRLRGEEDIQVVLLARTPSAILVPTEHGRLAIAAAREQDLIDALSRAARARQRLEDLAQVPPPAREIPAAQPEPEPHVLTGIERAELEERRAQERTRALAAPAEAVAPPALAEAPEAPVPPPATVDRGRGTARLGRPRPSAAFVLLPLLGSGLVWGAAMATGRLPGPESDLGRLTALGLVLAGPATSVGAIMARAWWPRLVGVVVTSGLAATVFVGRAVLGP